MKQRFRNLAAAAFVAVLTAPSAPRAAAEAFAVALAAPATAGQDGAVLQLAQPPSVEQAPSAAEPVPTPQPLPPTETLTLAALEQLALSNNPAISQAAAQVQALQGKWLQAGLPPNPSAGYVGSEIGSEGTAGQQGAYVGQNLITAGKLQRDRNIVAAEIDRAQQQLSEIYMRVRTDVRIAYYQALLAQRRVELSQEVLHVADGAVDASQALYNAAEIPLAGLLQTEITQQNAHVSLRRAENARTQAWRQLSAVLNAGPLPVQFLAGNVGDLPALLDWDEQLQRIQSTSPEVAAAMANLQRARRVLNRQWVEAVPDINAQVSVQYDNTVDSTIAGVQIGMPIPLWNRNQGGIRQAQAGVAQAMRNVERVEQNLNRRLAEAYRRYADSRIAADTYARDILPRSQRTLDLVRQGYSQGEVGYLDLLTAQQTFTQSNLIYLDALTDLWQSYNLIDGLLLEGSLSAETP